MTGHVSQFSDSALAILNAMPFSPDATIAYAHLAGGLVWSDEFPDVNSPAWKIVSHDEVYRYLIRIRRCITLDDSHLQQLPLWQQVAQFSPNWPGLRADRRTGPIVKRLRAAERLADRCLDKLEAAFDEDGQS